MEEEQYISGLLDLVTDPEIPVLSVNDLGIIRHIRCVIPNQDVEITITPTYSGCPAMDVISMNIKFTLLENGYKNIMIRQDLSPAWTTDWMSEDGKQKLRTYGIAPPVKNGKQPGLRLFEEPVKLSCPQCHSEHTQLISEFGSTACKSLYRCLDCGEPFDYFKCH